MRHALRFATLAFGLSILLSANAAQAQQQIRLQDDKGNPVKNADVIIDCDGTKREGVSDVDGLFSWRLIAGPTQCALIITSAATEILADVLDIPASGRVNRVIVLKQKPESLAKKGCPPDRLMSDGSCGTQEQALAQFDANCKRYIRGGIAVLSPNGGYECGCPPGQASVRGNGETSCRSRQAIAVDAAAACRRQNPALVAGDIGIDGSYECHCPEGQSWQSANRDNPSGRCVSITAIAADSARCERTMSGSVMGEDSQGRRGCVCPSGYAASAADRKCVSLAENSCPPERLIRDGKCGTPDKARAEYAGYCQNYLRGSIAVLTEQGYECGCPPGQASVSGNGERSCVSLRTIAINAVEACKRESLDLVPGEIRNDGSYDCRCPEGRTWQPASRNNPRGGCVSERDDAVCERTMTGSVMGEDKYGRRTCVCPPGYVESTADKKCVAEKSVENKDSIFWGTWNGVGNAKGITVTFNKDYTMTFSDTRPGYQRSGQGVWHRDPDRVDCVASPINYSLWYGNGRLTDPWGNIYNK